MSSAGRLYDLKSGCSRVKEVFGNTSGTSASFSASLEGPGTGSQLLSLLGLHLAHHLGKIGILPNLILKIVAGMSFFNIR